ncbi:MAG: tRNA (adenosine(37)-N6)-dimethylallyltransferase MiaA [Clostridia bacterium]|nr:tRNA (adenosine(37)-N6)-dimethylallyltransferase MiaA [Clostridia bacterium]
MDFVSPEQRYSVADFKKDSKEAIKKILSEEKIPIIVGGTGLYIDSLIYEIEYNDMKIDDKYRKELESIIEEKGLDYLYKQALEIDPEAMKIISKNDKKRIMRVLEIYHETGKTKTEQERISRSKEVEYDYKVFAINMDREVLYDRINKRVDVMIDNGLIEEVKNLLQKYKTFPTSMQGLGYKEVVSYFKKEITKEEMIEKIKQETRRYAKRQLTWFRKNKQTIWIDGQANVNENVDIIIKEYNANM